MRRHLAGDDDHRNGIQQRIGQRRHDIGRARAGGDERNARLAGRAGIAFCGVASTLLVAHQDVAQTLGRIKRIINRQNRSARIAEKHVDAVILERAHDDLGAGHDLGFSLGFRLGL